MSLGKAVLVCDLMRIASLRNVLHRGENYFNTSECGNFELFMLPEQKQAQINFREKMEFLPQHEFLNGRNNCHNSKTAFVVMYMKSVFHIYTF